MVTWTLVFYVTPLILNLITSLHDRSLAWIGFLLIGQLVSFLYNTYLQYTLVKTMIAMMGRFGR